jgi:hypothetical protein
VIDALPNRFELTCDSSEVDLAAARTCSLVAPVSAKERDDYWLAEVDPPFRGQAFGLGGDDISQVVIASALLGYPLSDIRNSTIPVYVARIIDPSVISSKTLKPDQIALMLWGNAKRLPDATPQKMLP